MRSIRNSGQLEQLAIRRSFWGFGCTNCRICDLQAIKMNKKGEERHGGKPKGWRKPEGVRAQHQVRAYDDEWEVIKDFVKVLRKVGVKRAKELISGTN